MTYLSIDERFQKFQRKTGRTPSEFLAAIERGEIVDSYKNVRLELEARVLDGIRVRA